MNVIYNEDCFRTMERMPVGMVSTILTSPPYNTNKKAGKKTTLGTMKSKGYAHVRYDAFVDNKTNAEYCEWTKRLFEEFDRILNLGGVVLYNLSYGAENTECMPLAISTILRDTNFTLADIIYWKKSNALPNNVSRLHLTRIVEPIFVFIRKSDVGIAEANKRVVSTRTNGQKMYENIFNFIEAKNNDGTCPLNKATFSTELCMTLLRLYTPRGGVVFDPFIGSGTTANACATLGLECFGSEMSLSQCEWAKKRLEKNGWKVDVVKG